MKNKISIWLNGIWSTMRWRPWRIFMANAQMWWKEHKRLSAIMNHCSPQLTTKNHSFRWWCNWLKKKDLHLQQHLTKALQNYVTKEVRTEKKKKMTCWMPSKRGKKGTWNFGKKVSSRKLPNWAALFTVQIWRQWKPSTKGNIKLSYQQLGRWT